MSGVLTMDKLNFHDVCEETKKMFEFDKYWIFFDLEDKMLIIEVFRLREEGLPSDGQNIAFLSPSKGEKVAKCIRWKNSRLL